MVDVEYIKMMLEPDSNERKIQPGDFIPYDVIEILTHGKVDPFKRCFAPAAVSFMFITKHTKIMAMNCKDARQT